MWDFTREVVINNSESINTTEINDSVRGRALAIRREGVYYLNNLIKTGSTTQVIDAASVTGSTNDITINTAGSPTVYVRRAQTAVNEVYAWTTPASISAGTYRIVLQLTLAEGNNIDFQRDLIVGGKEVPVEFTVRTSEAITNNKEDVADLIALKINRALKILRFDQYVQFSRVTTAAGAGSGSRAVVLHDLIATAQNQFIRFSEVAISSFDGDTEIYQGTETNNLLEFTTPLAGTSPAVHVSGVIDFGTAAYLRRHLRLRTNASVAPYTEYEDELPVDGRMYDQYTLNYLAPRDITGPGGVGTIQTGRVTIVLYILQGTHLTTLDAFFTDNGGTVTVI